MTTTMTATMMMTMMTAQTTKRAAFHLPILALLPYSLLFFFLFALPHLLEHVPVTLEAYSEVGI